MQLSAATFFRQHLPPGQSWKEAAAAPSAPSVAAPLTPPPKPAMRTRPIVLDQVFRRRLGPVPLQLLLEWLDQCCTTPPPEQSIYTWVLDRLAFKRGQINGALEALVRECLPYYRPGKHALYFNQRAALSEDAEWTPTRPMTYRQFCTVVRQILHVHRVEYADEELNIDHGQTIQLFIACPTSYEAKTPHARRG